MLSVEERYNLRSDQEVAPRGAPSVAQRADADEHMCRSRFEYRSLVSTARQGVAHGGGALALTETRRRAAKRLVVELPGVHVGPGGERR